MAPVDERTRVVVRALLARAADKALAQNQAKLYSHQTLLSLGQAGLRSFGPEDAMARLEEAERLLAAASVEREADAASDWRHAAKRAGELLEWLTNAGALGDEVPTSLLAAGAYQAAGYPALAFALLAQDEPEESPPNMLRLFLRGDFSGLLRTCHEELASLEQDRESGQDSTDFRMHRAIATETARAFLVLASAMRWKKSSRAPAAVRKLEALAAFARHSRVPYASLSARVCALVASEYMAARLWPRLTELSTGLRRPARRALNRFGRLAFGHGRSLLWPSQQLGVDRLQTNESFVLCTPTGSGKTTIAELALIADLLGYPTSIFGGAIALYLVPSRALASEVEGRLAADLGDAAEGVVVTGLYGGTDWGPTDAWLTTQKPTVLVCTYEKGEALIRFLGPLFMRRVRCVVIDEAHSVQFDSNQQNLRRAESRSLRLEALVVRLLEFVNGQTCRIIALSAVTAGLEDGLSQWLVDEEAKPAKSSYRSTRQLIGRLICDKRAFRIEYDLLDRNSLLFANADDAPYVPNPFVPHPPAPSCEGPDAGPMVRLRPYLAWASMQLTKADEHGRAHSVLVSIASNITSYAKAYLDLIEVDWQGFALPQFFSRPTDEDARQLWSECVATMADYFTVESPEYRLLQHGIVVHHGKMPALLARRLKLVIERGIVRLVLATSTLSEGVNLPVEYILIPEVYRNNERLSSREFLNLVGRAGRPGHGTEGRALVLLPPTPSRQNRSRSAFSARRLTDGYEELIDEIRSEEETPPTPDDASPLANLLRLLKEEWSALAGNTSPANFRAWLESTVPTNGNGDMPAAGECLDTLDGLLLASLEELEQMRIGGGELSSTERESGLRRIWLRTFAKLSADADELQDTFLRRGSAIPQLYPDRGERRRIYKTSLPPASARQLLSRVDPIKSLLQRGSFYSQGSREERYQFVESVVSLIADVPRFAPDPKAGKARANWRHILLWWLDPGAATNRPGPNQVGGWHEYASRNFTYRCTWALGSVVSLCLDSVEGGQSAIALSLEDWPKSGLPWAAFWLKELLTWGTLEPVAGFLLARGLAVTRQEAESRAALYYQQATGRDDSVLDPRAVGDWAEASMQTPARPVDRRRRTQARLDARLVAPAESFKRRRVRVIPARNNNGTDWFDIAGYRVAVTSAPLDSTWRLENTDFVLDVDHGAIEVRPYL